MDAANDVRAEPMVETSWPLHIQAKLRLRKTAKGERGADATAPAVIFDSCFDYLMASTWSNNALLRDKVCRLIEDYHTRRLPARPARGTSLRLPRPERLRRRIEGQRLRLRRRQPPPTVVVRQLTDAERTQLGLPLAAASPSQVSPVAAETEAQYAEIVGPKDAHVVVAAVHGEAAFLVTLDRKHLANDRVRAAGLPLAALTPGEFIRLILADQPAT